MYAHLAYPPLNAGALNVMKSAKTCSNSGGLIWKYILDHEEYCRYDCCFEQCFYAWWRHQMETFRRYWPLVRKTTGHRCIPITKVSDAELCCAPEQTIEQTVETPAVIWDAIALIMTSLDWSRWIMCILHKSYRFLLYTYRIQYRTNAVHWTLAGWLVTRIVAWISNHMHYLIRYGITFLCHNFN